MDDGVSGAGVLSGEINGYANLLARENRKVGGPEFRFATLSGHDAKSGLGQLMTRSGPFAYRPRRPHDRSLTSS
jgi:hypothetical protein